MHRLPDNLDSIQRTDYFPELRHRWNTNEEIASILIGLEEHEDWLSNEVKTRPKSGSMLLYSRKKVRYRRDGYCWKKRKDGKTTREDHMKLKVQGVECIYGCYVHSALLPTFHRRCYWLLQNPDIVLVHYLNVPFSDDNKIATPILNSFLETKKEWTKEELVTELEPMFFSENDSDLNSELSSVSSIETIECIVQQMMTRQRAKIKALEESSSKLQRTGLQQSGPSCSSSIAIRSDRVDVSSNRLNLVKSKNILMKKEITRNENGIMSENQNNNSVQLLSLASSPSTQASCSSTTTPAAVSTSQANTTPLIFNLSQFQNGNGILILNSTSITNARSQGEPHTPSLAAPVTIVYPSHSENNTSFNVPRQVTAALDTAGGQTANAFQLPSFSSNRYLDFASSPNSSDANGNTSGTSSRSRIQYQPMETSMMANVETSFGTGCMNSSNSSLSGSPPNSSHDMTNGQMTLASDPFMRSVSSGITTQELSSSVRNVGGENKKHQELQQDPSNGDCSSVKCNQNNSKQFSETDSNDMNSMDFIENELSSPGENLFNLEAFEMLTDLPNFDDLNSNGNLPDNSSISNNNFRSSNMPQITDYSPDWSYPEGGMKVLVAGPWSSPTLQYSVIFDGICVPTSLIQNGVLRCFSPAHEPGYVSLQVFIEGNVVSNSVIFEYREHPSTPLNAQTADENFAIDTKSLDVRCHHGIRVPRSCTFKVNKTSGSSKTSSKLMSLVPPGKNGHRGGSGSVYISHFGFRRVPSIEGCVWDDHTRRGVFMCHEMFSHRNALALRKQQQQRDVSSVSRRNFGVKKKSLLLPSKSPVIRERSSSCKRSPQRVILRENC